MTKLSNIAIFVSMFLMGFTLCIMIIFSPKDDNNHKDPQQAALCQDIQLIEQEINLLQQEYDTTWDVPTKPIIYTRIGMKNALRDRMIATYNSMVEDSHERIVGGNERTICSIGG